MAALEAYRKKRDFRKTPEPAGETRESEAGEGGLFVIQKHAAQRLHFDLRLEKDGVLKSWAVPKGPSLEPGEKRLAVQVEDHPLEYGEFEGVIPEDEYGGGTVMLWDRGRWKPRGKNTEHHIDFELEGRKLRGVWTLVRMRDADDEEGENWLLIKRSDDWTPDGKAKGSKRGSRTGAQSPLAAVDGEDLSVATGRTMKQIASDRDAVWTSEGLAEAQRARVPEAKAIPGARKKKLADDIQPQLATLVEEAPGGDEWIHEIKFDGYRILARFEGGVVKLLSRNGKDWTDRFPEAASLLAELPVEQALLDGEMVAFAADGSTSFRRLQESLSEGKTSHLVYHVFDLLHLNGYDLSATTQVDRKEALRSLLDASGFVGHGLIRYTDHLEGKGPAFFAQACGLGLEGIICKRMDGRYASGRTRQWLKVKCTRHVELLIGGYTDPGGSRNGFGALLLGAYDGDGKLVYAGKVGTGFSDRQLETLHERLEEIEEEKSPFEDPPPKRGVHWVTPTLVAEVEFTEWTRDGSLRHPSFRGLREDRDPEEIRMNRGEMPAVGRGAKAEKAGGTRPGRQPEKRTGERRKRMAPDEEEVAGVRLTSPDRVLYPDQGVTKLALARYYEDIADWILPHVESRPLSLVRCPQGREDECFFQKHPSESMAKDVPRVIIEESDGPEPYLYIRKVEDLIAMVQMGVLELHVWGSKVDDVEKPDLLVFDLDPAPDVPWAEMLRVAKELRERLQGLGMEPFPRTTGGKGLHLMVPLRRKAGWDEVKAFAQGVAVQHAADDPSRLTTNMSKAKRRGKIFLDYLRNGRGATAIASYSTRAKEGATVAVPVRWDEVNAALRPDRYHIDNLRRRLSALKDDPWEGFAEARRAVTPKLLERVEASG
ncbi:MAG TPA: DNA ligase D [Trueperaceae bacterium]